MSGVMCERCPLWARCLLNYGGTVCKKAAKEAGVDVRPTIFEKIKDMDIDEMAEWLFNNCEYLSAEYGDCSGAEDSHRMLEFLKSVED